MTLKRVEAGSSARNGVKGSPEMESHLEIYGFHYAIDAQKDEYYVGPASHIIHLYSDGTWDSDKASAGWSLDQYLDWVHQLNARLAIR